MMAPSPIPAPMLTPQRSALRIEVMTLRPQCPARPTCLDSLFETVSGRRVWGNHRPCSTPCNCAVTPDRILGAATVLREDEAGRPWLMHRAEGDWGEHGRPLKSWGAILCYRVTFGDCVEQDAGGRFIRVYPEAQS